MALPTERIVTGTYVNPVNGEPYDGSDGSNYVIFEPIPDRWTDRAGNQILLGGGKVTLDESGHFSEGLVCTDAADVFPAERLWRIRQFIGGTWSNGVFALPAGTGSLDITDILSSEVNDVEYVPTPGPAGETGPAGPSAYDVAVANGFVGTEAQWLATLEGPQGVPGLSGGMDTGITSGGDISVNASNPLAIDISPLSGQIVDYLADPVTVTPVVLTTTLTVELDSVAQTRSITWLLADASLNVYQQANRPTPEDRRTYIVLGMVAQDAGSIFLAQSIPTVASDPVNQLYDLMDSIGAFNISGNDVSPAGNNLFLNVGTGKIFSRGWNHFDGPSETNNPHITTTVGATPAQWTHILRNSELTHASQTATVDVGHYDNAGTLTAISGADTSVVHQLWMFPTNEGEEVHVLQYGQQTYATLDDAVSAAGKEAYATNPALPGNAINLGFLAVKGSAANLSDSTQALFVKAGRFGSGPGGGAAVDLSGYALLAGAEFTGPVSSTLNTSSDVAQSSRTTVNTNDLWRRLVDGEMQWGSGTGPMDTFLKRLGVGLLALLNSDLLIGQEDAKAYRLRQSGGALDLDASGADLFLSVYELVNFLGTQHTYLRLESGAYVAHAGGVWQFGDGPDDTSVHTIDGVNNLLGLFGATPVGRQTVAGERSTGAALQSLLDGLEALGLITDTSTAGAAVVQTVNGESGPDVTLSASNVGAVDIASVGAAGGVASLGLDGKIPSGQLPASSVTSVNGETGAVSLSAADVGAVDTTAVGAANGVASLGSDGKVPSGQLPAAPVTSVNGETGAVSLSAADVGALDQTAGDARYTRQDSLVFNAVEHGAVGDGVADDATIINNLLSTSPAGSVVILPPRIYGTGVPIVVPPGKTLMGLRSDLMTVTGLYEPNVMIKPLSTFTGVAAIRFLDQTDGGYSAISGEQRVINLTLDGSNIAAGVDGIQAKGNIQNVALRDVTIRRFPNSGIYCGLQGGVAPYSWRMHRVMLDNNHGHGFFGERMVDLTAVDCQAIGNWSNGWMIQNGANGQMVGCRAEWNGNHGFYLSGSWGTGAGSGGMVLSGCSTDRNGFNGVYVDATGTPPIVFSGLATRRDGRNGGAGGGGYAGFAVNAATTPVTLTGWANFPGVDDDGTQTNSPQYGVSVTGSALVQIENAYIHAATTALNDGGSNTLFQLGSNIVLATGTTATPSRTVQTMDASRIGSGTFASARIPDLSATYLTAAQKAAANGVASLDATTKVPTAQIPSLPASQITSGTFAAARIPDLSATYLTVAQRAAANGVASLDASTLVPVAQIPSLPASQVTSGTFSTARIPDLSATYIATVQKAVANGVASLDASTLVPVAQIPSLPASQITSGTFASARIPDLSATYIAVTQKNAANGVAGLDASSKLSGAQQTYSTTAASVASSNSAGAANTASRGDHTHAGVTSVNGSQGAVTVSTATLGAVPTSAVGAASGVASLGSDSKVPLAQLRNAFFNVKDYGALGDGSTIDTTTMQAALDAAHAAGGGTVIIPPTSSFYAVDTFLVVYENCTIWAYGATIKSVSTNTGLLRNFLGTDLFSGYAGRSNIKIFGGIWDGNASDGSTGTVTAETDVLNFVHCTNILVQDATIQNVSSAHALEFNSTDGGRAINCRFLGYRDNSGTSNRQFSEALQIDISHSGSSSIGNFDDTPSKNIVVQGCYFGSSSRLGSFGRAVGSHTLAASTTYDNIQVIGNRIEGTIQDGIYAYGWRRSIISNNVITGAGFSGIKITMPDPASTSTSPHTLDITGNVIEAAVADSGIRALGFSTYKIPGINISDNTIKSITSGNGIHAENCAAPNIDGNTVDTTSSTGIYCNFSDSSSVSGNTVKNAGSNGINIAGSVYANVTGNLVDTTTSNFGIFVGQGSDATTNSTNATITGNTIIAPSSAGIRLSTNATGCMVSSNTVRKGAGSPSNALSMAASATGCSILNNDFSGNNWSAATAMSTSTALPFTGPGGMQALPGSNLVDLDFNPLPTLEAYMRPSGRYETTSRLRLGTTSTPTSGTLYLVPIWLPAGLVVSNITFISGGTAASSPTNYWFTLHNSSKVAVARTADQTTTAWAANTVKTLAIAQTTAGTATSYTTLNSGLHYLGVMIKATTVCNLVSEGSVADVVASVSPGFGGTDTGLSTPPTVTAGAFTAGAFGAGSGILVYGYTS